MTVLKNISNDRLLKNTLLLAHKERAVTLDVLHHLREVERRNLYAERGHSSLFEYAVRELNYSEGAAHRRIASMRLLNELPAIEAKIESGALSLSTLAQAQTFFRHERTVHGQKLEVLSTLEGRSAREVERELLIRSSAPENLQRDRLRAVSATHTELKILVEVKVLEELEELRGLLAHSQPHATIRDLVSFSIARTLRDLRPKAPKAKEQPPAPIPPSSPAGSALPKAPPFPASKVRNDSRYIRREIKRQVWRRDQGQCTFVSKDGKPCTCRHALQYDHIRPFAIGGKPTVENLRLRCRVHNQLAAIEVFGTAAIARFVPRLA